MFEQKVLCFEVQQVVGQVGWLQLLGGRTGAAVDRLFQEGLVDFLVVQLVYFEGYFSFLFCGCFCFIDQMLV